MRRQDFEFLLDLLKENAGWEFDEAQYFILDKKMSNFIREKGFNSIEELVVELKTNNRPLISQVVEAMAFSDTAFFRDFDVCSLLFFKVSTCDLFVSKVFLASSISFLFASI